MVAPDSKLISDRVESAGVIGWEQGGCCDGWGVIERIDVAQGVFHLFGLVGEEAEEVVELFDRIGLGAATGFHCAVEEGELGR